MVQRYNFQQLDLLSLVCLSYAFMYHCAVLQNYIRKMFSHLLTKLSILILEIISEGWRFS